jgi:type VI secretion system FHA domain protein
MALKLRVSTCGNQPMGAAVEHVFDELGGTIGRTRGNDLALPDSSRVVSGRHAEIRFANGDYFIRDTSTNGTVINTFEMANGEERPLRNGDRLKIGPYEISAVIDDEQPQSSGYLPGRREHPAGAVDPGIAVEHGATLDPLELLSRGSDSASTPASSSDFDFGRQSPQSDHSSPESMGFEAPRAIPDPDPFPPQNAPLAGIPENWDETGFRGGSGNLPESQASGDQRVRVTESAPRTPVAPPASAKSAAIPPSHPGHNAGEHGAIAALLHSAGVPIDKVTDETYAVLGEIINVVVQGTIEMLRARAQIKDQFRVPATMMKPVENNPLKFSIDAQDALHNLFGKRNPGYQSPVDAFQEGFEDIKAHQMAMIAGMRAAYKAMLEYFDPNDLEREFDKGLKRGVLGGVLNQTRYWDLYEDLYKSLVKDPDASFQRLFGDAFGRAYEEQMQRLSTLRGR